MKIPPSLGARACTASLAAGALPRLDIGFGFDHTENPVRGTGRSRMKIDGEVLANVVTAIWRMLTGGNASSDLQS
ncbi:hypothetical protein QD460_07125 [Rhizobium jaguaris]|uniref:hypothetical protein n=1 Tax=Rhizobium jaguaris TaxID=1312183 RepID=UPI0039BFE7AD